jgi:DNA modification methylase
MSATIITGDAREAIGAVADATARTCVTSPPYWGLRDYGADDQIGLESSIDDYVSALVGAGTENWVGNGRRNRRTVWSVTTKPTNEHHFATFPPDLIETCIAAGSAPGDLVIDPFSGTATTGLVALRLGRRYLGVELNPAYAEASRERLRADAPLLNRGVT